LRAEVVVGGPRAERRVRLPVEPPLETEWWAFRRVEVPDGARALRLVLRDRGAGATEWLAVTAPVAPTYSSFASATQGQAVFREAYLWWVLPCREEPAATDGIIQPYTWSLGPPTSTHAKAIAQEYAMVERGCVYPKRRDSADTDQALRLCAFEYARPDH
jgi:hypothetical protein